MCAPRTLLLSLGGSTPRLPQHQLPCSGQGTCKRQSALCRHMGDKRSPPSVPGWFPPLFLNGGPGGQPSQLCSSLPRSWTDLTAAASRLRKPCRGPRGSSPPALLTEVVPISLSSSLSSPLLAPGTPPPGPIQPSACRSLPQHLLRARGGEGKDTLPHVPPRRPFSAPPPILGPVILPGG